MNATGSKTYISADTARRVTKFLWAINDTPYWFHQTLTFSGSDPARHNAALATARLNALLDQLDKARPDYACIWVREKQWNKGIHFHVIFLFFGDRAHNPTTLHRELRPDVFKRWNKLNGGNLVPKANRMTLPPYRARDARSFGYITADVRIDERTDRAAKGESWWGRRNVALIEANSREVCKKEASDALKALFRKRRKYVCRMRAAVPVARSLNNAFNQSLKINSTQFCAPLVARPEGIENDTL